MLTEILLVILLAAQQWFYMRHIHMLLEKLMARDIVEFKQATDPQPIVPRTKADEGPVEDLSVLNGFSV